MLLQCAPIEKSKAAQQAGRRAKRKDALSPSLLFSFSRRRAPMQRRSDKQDTQWARIAERQAQGGRGGGWLLVRCTSFSLIFFKSSSSSLVLLFFSLFPHTCAHWPPPLKAL